MQEKKDDFVLVKLKFTDAGGYVPRQATPQSAGFDLAATADVTIEPGCRATLDMGFAMELPSNMCAMLLTRSGMDIKEPHVYIPRTRLIDSDYRGEIKVDLKNGGSKPYTVQKGDRIAQMLILPWTNVYWVQKTQDDSEVVRGEGGFGSSGK